MRLTLDAFGITFYLILLSGVVMGSSLGYEAESAEEASIEYQNEEIVIGDERTDASFESDLDQNDVIEGAVYSAVSQIYDAGMVTSITAADAAASWTYENRSWMPSSVLSVLFYIALALPMGYALLRTKASLEAIRR